MTPEKPKPNPYRVTKRDLDSLASPDDHARPVGLLIVTVINGFSAFIAAACAGSVFGNFAEVFTGFGAQLPTATKILLDSTWLWWLLALAGIAMAVWVIVNPVPAGQTAQDEMGRRQLQSAYGFTAGFRVLRALPAHLQTRGSSLKAPGHDSRAPPA